MKEEDQGFSLIDPSQVSSEEARVLASVLEAVRQIKFGYIQLTIQDGQVIQIDRMEKQRLSYNKSSKQV